MFVETEKLQQVIQLGLEIADIRDLDILLERVLLAARRFLNADAGSVYTREDNKLRFSHAQNDTLVSRLEPGKKLVYTTFELPIDSHSIAGYVAETGTCLNIPDVYSLASDVPFSFGRHYDAIANYRTQSMLTVPLKTTRGRIAGVLQIINAKNPQGEVVPFDAALEPFVRHFANDAAAAIERAQLTRTTILRMIRMAELRDPKETGPHVNRVASYAVEIYEAYAGRKGIPHDEMETTRDTLRMASMLHDVGKIAISDMILGKPAKLTDEEYAIMKRHTVHGARLFFDSQSEFDEMAREVALNHHERWDGRGYPGYIDYMTGLPLPGKADEQGRPIGKKGEEIPLAGRIAAVADVYDALSARRVYKEPWTEEQVLTELTAQAGKQFDPDVIAAFHSCLEMIRAAAQRYPDLSHE